MALVVLGWLGFPAAPAGALADDPDVLSILVVGDSYSAGNGAGSYYGPRGCFRSEYNYGRQFERIIEGAPYNQRAFVETAACSGAVTEDFFSSREGRPPMIASVNDGYDLIFLTIGGNDIHFGDIVRYCLVARTRDAANCAPNLGRAERLLADGTLTTRITRVLESIRGQAAQDAKIVLLGYPYLEADPNYTMRTGHFGRGELVEVGRRVRALGLQGDVIQRHVVDHLNNEHGGNQFHFVETKSLFAGPPTHELYAKKTNRDRWMVQPFIDASLATWQTWYHPNPRGWLEEAKLLVNDPWIPKQETAPPPPTSPHAPRFDPWVSVNPEVGGLSNFSIEKFPDANGENSATYRVTSDRGFSWDSFGPCYEYDVTPGMCGYYLAGYGSDGRSVGQRECFSATAYVGGLASPPTEVCTIWEGPGGEQPDGTLPATITNAIGRFESGAAYLAAYYTGGGTGAEPIADGGTYICLAQYFPVRYHLTPETQFWTGTAQENAVCASYRQRILPSSIRNYLLRSSTGSAWFLNGSGVRQPITDGGTFQCLADRYFVLDFTADSEIGKFPLGSAAFCS